MPEINLLQNRLTDTTMIATKRTKIAIWVMLVLMAAIVGAGTVLHIRKNNINHSTAQITIENGMLQSEINRAEKDLTDAKTYQAQLSNIKLLLDEHLYITPLFLELGKDTYQRAQYISMDAQQETGKIHLEGVVDSYTGLGKLLLGLSTSKYFKNVRLLAVTPSGSTASAYNFSLDFNVVPEIFTPQVEQPK